MTTGTMQGRLREAREIAGLSARELSGLAKLSFAMVSMIERKEIESPTADTLSKLAHALGISLDWLVDGNGPSPKQKNIAAAVERARAEKAA